MLPGDLILAGRSLPFKKVQVYTGGKAACLDGGGDSHRPSSF